MNAGLTTCALACALAVACTNSTGSGEGETTSDASTGEDDRGETTWTQDPEAPAESSEGTGFDDTGEPVTRPSCPDGTPDCVAIDLLVVIDNSATMFSEQEKIARAMPQVAERLRDLHAADGTPLTADVQIMVTNSDFGAPDCALPPGSSYQPVGGTPVFTGCNARIEQFVDPLDPQRDASAACTDACPTDVTPQQGTFITFRTDDPAATNLPKVDELDIDGDGDPDDAVERSLACLGPQGIHGCGYESQLETMLQSLDPEAAWNQGSMPFHREGSILAIALLTDEADCSISDYSMLSNEELFNIDPATGQPAASSGLCWNAGVDCWGPNAEGEFTHCEAEDGPLHPLSRYDHFFEYVKSTGREVVMLGVLGIPTVRERDPQRPYLSGAGGVGELEIRTWRDGVFPDGDLLPAEIEAGVTAAELAFEYSVGPGCHAVDTAGALVDTALPPVRIRSVCEALDDPDAGPDGKRCCLESICDGDYRPAFDCLGALIENAAR